MTAHLAGAYIPAGGLAAYPLGKPFHGVSKRFDMRRQPARASTLFSAPSVEADWASTETGTEAIARTLGMWPARAGESWGELRARLLHALHGGHHG